MALLSTHLYPIFFLLPSSSNNITKLSSFSLKPLQNLQITKSLSLKLSKLTSSAPLKATYDIPISIRDDEHEKFLDSEPWKGAVVYKRDPSVTHVEFSTSLDELTVGWVSSRVSADRATLMGLKLRPDLEDNMSDVDQDEDEDDEQEEEEVGDEKGEDDLFGDDFMIEGEDENGNPIMISGKELRNAEIKVEYANEHGELLGGGGIDDDDDDDEEDKDEDKDDNKWVDTPVLVSVDVTRKKGRIRLDGIIRTVISLDCCRCLAPAAECIYSNFSLLLSEEPIEEAPLDYLGSVEEMFEDNNASKISWQDTGLERDEDEDIDWDDRLYFPSGEKEIDISKHIRDIIHLKITMNGLCSSGCKGKCFDCGNNLNWSNCTCKKVKRGEKEYNDGDNQQYGPLWKLRTKMEGAL